MPVFENTPQGRAMREIVAHFHADNRLGKRMKNGEFQKNLAEPEWKLPEGYTLTMVETQNFVMELLEPEDCEGQVLLLQLHGGGYISGMRNVYRNFAHRYSELGGRIPVMTPDYRVAPEHPYPAALEDASVAWHCLLDTGWRPEQIIMAGDSAGGGLAMALCMFLKDQGEALPAGLIAMSPWTDLTLSGESYETNYHKDPVFGNTRDSMIFSNDYPQQEDRTNPYISPLFGDFTGFPPMLVQVGSYEMLLSDAEAAARKAKEAGVKVRLSIYEGMFHVFQMAMGVIPESRLAWKEVRKFLDIIREDLPESHYDTE